jgi:hypothetical protein
MIPPDDGRRPRINLSLDDLDRGAAGGAGRGEARRRFLYHPGRYLAAHGLPGGARRLAAFAAPPTTSEVCTANTVCNVNALANVNAATKVNAISAVNVSFVTNAAFFANFISVTCNWAWTKTRCSGEPKNLEVRYMASASLGSPGGLV